MATSLVPGTLIVTIDEQITMNGMPLNSQNKLTLSSIGQADKRIVQLPQGSEVTLINFSSAVAAGTFVRGVMKYFRVTNKDAVNYARIRYKKSGADVADFKLEAGKSFMLGVPNLNVSETAQTFVTFEDLDSINAQAYDGNIDVEFFVAST